MLTRDSGGTPAEKRGNTAWLCCSRCGTWFPVSPRMLDEGAPACVCPVCLAEFRPAAGPRPDGA